jgi:PleD family two-component response regulator
MNDIRVLFVEDELADARFIREALAEIEETTHGGAWLHCNVTHLERLDDAVLVLGAETMDVVLFNPALPDSRGMATFTALHDAAPNVPLIALVEPGDEGLGRRMLREGAQDYIVKSEIDVDPLAGAILNGIERQRFVRAALRSTAGDPESGFATAPAFDALASRDLLLARDCGRSLVLMMAEIDNFEDLDAACGRSAAHEFVMAAANVIRTVVGEYALVGRLGTNRFAILEWRRTPEELIGALQTQVGREHQPFAFVFGYTFAEPCSSTTLVELIAAAETMLCENKHAYSNLP